MASPTPTFGPPPTIFDFLRALLPILLAILAVVIGIGVAAVVVNKLLRRARQ